MQQRPTNQDDVIDSRDVIEAIAEIEAELEDMPASGTEPDPDDRAELIDELATLKALEAEAEGYAADWRYGETLIRDSYFEDYAEQLAEDLGVLGQSVDDGHFGSMPRRKVSDTWPFTCIDWAEAADELRVDYTSVSFDGVDYWVR